MTTQVKNVIVGVVFFATIFAYVSTLSVGIDYNPYSDMNPPAIWSEGTWTKILSWQHPSFFMVGQDNTDNPMPALIGLIYLIITIAFGVKMYSHKEYEKMCAIALILIAIIRLGYWMPYWFS